MSLSGISPLSVSKDDNEDSTLFWCCVRKCHNCDLQASDAYWKEGQRGIQGRWVMYNMWAHRRTLIFLTHMSTWGHVFSSLKIAQMTLLIDSCFSSAYKVPGIFRNAGGIRVTRLLPSQELVSCNGKGFEKRKWSLSWNLKEELAGARWQG